MANVAVLGGGSWGCALAMVLHHNGHQVKVWMLREASVKEIEATHELRGKLPGVQIPEGIRSIDRSGPVGVALPQKGGGGKESLALRAG